MRLLRGSSDSYGRGKRGRRARSEEIFRVTFRRAADAAQSGDVDGAEKVLREAVATADDIAAPRAAFALAQLLERAGRPAEADRAYAEAATLSDPELTPDVHCNLAARWAALGRTGDAIEAYDEIVNRIGQGAHPDARDDAAVAAFRLGELHAESGDTPAARKAWGEAMKAPDQETAARATLALARHLHEQDDQSRSVDGLLHDVIERDHHDCSPEARLILGDRLVARGDDERAYEMYALAAETKHPRFASEATDRTNELLSILHEARRRTAEGVPAQGTAPDTRRQTITRELKQNVGDALDEIDCEDERPVGSPGHCEYDPEPELAEIEQGEE